MLIDKPYSLFSFTASKLQMSPLVLHLLAQLVGLAHNNGSELAILICLANLKLKWYRLVPKS